MHINNAMCMCLVYVGAQPARFYVLYPLRENYICTFFVVAIYYYIINGVICIKTERYMSICPY